MLEVWVYDIPGGERRVLVATVGSVQMTGTDLRDEDGNIILYWNPITSGWVVPSDGSEWFDFTASLPL